MFNFDEAKVLQEHKNGLSIVGATEKAVDEVVKRGYKNIFYIGIGGTVLYANQMAHIVRKKVLPSRCSSKTQRTSVWWTIPIFPKIPW